MSVLWPRLDVRSNGRVPSRLVLVRHGETDWNRRRIVQGHADVPLNENGKTQARAVARRLAGEKLDVLYTSDLSRARETADEIGAACGLAVRPDARLREIDVGAWSGLSRKEIRKRHPETVAALERGEDPLRGDGESLVDLRARVVAAYDDLAAAHPGETVAVVGHGGSLKVLIGHLLGLADARLTQLSVAGNTGVSLFDFRDGFPRLVMLNCTRHLHGVVGN
jgi:probable phosphoglycerate mutase